MDDAPGSDAQISAGHREREREGGQVSGRSRKRWAWLAVGLALLVVGAGAGFVLTGGAGLLASGGSDAGGGEWLEIPASGVAFETLEGSPVSIGDHAGEVVLLNFWGTWCPPCRYEIPELIELQDAVEARGGTVIGVAVDSGRPDEIRSFAEEFGVNYPIWISGARKALTHYDAVGYPFTVLIDREGVIRKQYLGPQTVETLLSDMEAFL